MLAKKLGLYKCMGNHVHKYVGIQIYLRYYTNEKATIVTPQQE